jgi:hypothetical protein
MHTTYKSNTEIEFYLPGYIAVESVESHLTFRRNTSFPPSELNNKSSKMTSMKTPAKCNSVIALSIDKPVRIMKKMAIFVHYLTIVSLSQTMTSNGRTIDE